MVCAAFCLLALAFSVMFVLWGFVVVVGFFSFVCFVLSLSIPFCFSVIWIEKLDGMVDDTSTS